MRSRRPHCSRQLDEQGHRLVGDPVLGVVEVAGRSASAISRSPRPGSSANSSRRCRSLELAVLGLERRPGQPVASVVASCRPWLRPQPSACASMRSIRSFQEATNDAAPSLWSCAASAVTSIPASANRPARPRSRRRRAPSGRRGSPWSSKASRVPSGMVLTVLGAARPVDVERVGGVGVLGAGAGPQQPLRPSAGVRRAAASDRSRAPRDRPGRCRRRRPGRAGP